MEVRMPYTALHKKRPAGHIHPQQRAEMVAIASYSGFLKRRASYIIIYKYNSNRTLAISSGDRPAGPVRSFPVPVRCR